MSLDNIKIKRVVEAALMAVDKPLSLTQLGRLFRGDPDAPDKARLREIIAQLQQECEHRGASVVEVASGFRLQIDQDISPWISKLFEERPPRYSRALLETLSLIAYRQPLTRTEIEEVRGVAVSTNIIRTLLEREWIRVVGHKDVPGRPAMYATTKEFLDYFNLKRIDELPPLSELTDLDKIAIDPQMDLALDNNDQAANPAAADDADAAPDFDENPDQMISSELADDPVGSDHAADGGNVTLH